MTINWSLIMVHVNVITWTFSCFNRFQKRELRWIYLKAKYRAYELVTLFCVNRIDALIYTLMTCAAIIIHNVFIIMCVYESKVPIDWWKIIIYLWLLHIVHINSSSHSIRDDGLTTIAVKTTTTTATTVRKWCFTTP